LDELATNPMETRKLINSDYAGSVFPTGKLSPKIQQKYPNSVRFTQDGYPDFSPYAKITVKVKGMRGEYNYDERLANLAAGLKETPKDYVWHHHQDCETMLLVPKDIHRAVRHSGGASLLRERCNGGVER
jgi:filamentous hemagglutinin